MIVTSCLWPGCHTIDWRWSRASCAHILWSYGLYFSVQRYIRHRIAIVPFGDVERLKSIDNVTGTS
jgi:hypothetical protein